MACTFSMMKIPKGADRVAATPTATVASSEGMPNRLNIVTEYCLLQCCKQKMFNTIFIQCLVVLLLMGSYFY